MELLFVTQVLLGILVSILLFQLVQMKKQVGHIVEEVENYICFVTEDAKSEEEEIPTVEKEAVQKDSYLYVQKNASEKKAEVQNRLIQDILQEYFT